MNLIKDILSNMQASDQTTDIFNVRQSGLYMGLQCEELAEKLSAILGPKNHQVIWLDTLATEFKRGDHDYLIKDANRVAMLDGDIDMIVVSIGAAFSQGANMSKAWKRVHDSNVSKRNPETGKIDKDTNGKWVKAPGYVKPELSDCVLTK